MTMVRVMWAKAEPNNFSCNSVKDGHLNPPLLLPGILQKSVASFLVSIAGIDCRRLGIFFRRNSQPTMLLSKLILCPTTNFTFSSSCIKISKTSDKAKPSFSALSVEIPWIFEAL